MLLSSSEFFRVGLRSSLTFSLKKSYMLIFVFVFAVFSLVYFSFFPGRFTLDSYSSYSMALGRYPLIDFNSPFFVQSWRILGNYNAAPFILNYILISTSCCFIFYKMKHLLLPQLVLCLFILIPGFFLSFIFAWKDNLLMSALLLLVALLIQDKPKILFPLFGVLFILTSFLRINAVFATVPLLWFYCGELIKESQIKKLALFLGMMIGFFCIYQLIVFKGLGAIRQSYIQQIFATDILKINYKLHEKTDLPSAFLEDVSADNLDAAFKRYEHYPSNDYFFYKIDPSCNPVLKTFAAKQDSEALRSLWVNTVSTHFGTYLSNRFQQWYKMVTSVNYIYGEPFQNQQIDGFAAYTPLFFHEPQNYVMKRIRAFYDPPNMEAHYSIWLKAGAPLVYLIGNLLCLLYLFIKRKHTELTLENRSVLASVAKQPRTEFYSSADLDCFATLAKTDPHALQPSLGLKLVRKQMDENKLIIALLLSGIFYILGYLPILPAGDYRYFNWTIMSFWLALGLLVDSGIKCKEKKLSRDRESCQ